MESDKYHASAITPDDVLYVNFDGTLVIINRDTKRKYSLPYGDCDKATFVMGLWLTVGWSLKDIVSETFTMYQKFKFMGDMGMFEGPPEGTTEEEG